MILLRKHQFYGHLKINCPTEQNRLLSHNTGLIAKDVMYIPTELKTPIVSTYLTEYLQRVFSFSSTVLRTDFKTNDELVGFQKGIEEVINHLIRLSDIEE